MKKNILFLFVILSNIVFAQQPQSTEWMNFPVATKCEFVGKYKEHYIHAYLNKGNKLVLRKYKNDLKNWEEQNLNIEIPKNYYYQKSVVINNLLTHLISQFSPEENKIRLWAYVPKDAMETDFEKYKLIECDYYFGKSWLYDMSAFSQFNIKFSNDKSKFYVQQKETQNPLIFNEKEKMIIVYDTKNLSKPINGYKYVPQRMYLEDSGIKVLNNGSICKSDSYRIENLKTKKISKFRFRLKHKSLNSKNINTVFHISEDTTITSLEFKEIDSNIFASGIKFETIKRKNHFFNYVYSSDNFKLLDSTIIAYTDNIPEVDKAFAHALITTHKVDSENLYFLTSQIELSKNNSYIDYKNIGIYTYNSNLKEVKSLCNFPVKYGIQTFRRDILESNDIENPLFLNFSEKGIEMLYKDFTENEKALQYKDYIKNKNSKDIALVYAKIDPNGNFSKKHVLMETKEKRSIDYKQSVFLENNIVYLMDSKNKQFTLLQL